MSDKHRQILVLCQNGQLDEAKSICNDLLARNAEDADALNLLGSVYIQERLYKTACKYLERCVKIKAHPVCLNNLGVVYKNLDCLEKAEQCFSRAVEIERHNTDANLNLGILLYEQKRYEEAYKYLENIEECHDYSYFYYYGRLKLGNGEFNDAQELFNRALALENQDVDEEIINNTKEYLSYAYLAHGDLANGWSLYGYRSLSMKERKRLIDLGCDLPFWCGEDLPESNLLVVAEDGLGDELMYTSSLNLLENKFKQIYLECDSRLRPLFARTYPDIIFFNRNDDTGFIMAAEKCDHFVLLGDLQRYLNPNMQFNSDNTMPLLPNLDNSAKLREKLLHVYGHKKLIGISYCTFAQNASSRMLPQEVWEEIFQSCPQANFFNLQENNLTLPDKKSFLYDNEHLLQIDGIDLYNDITGLADVIYAMDSVVSIGNYVIHLAGRLAKPCALILPELYNCRWLVTKDKPWYPTAKLIQKGIEENWANVRQEVINFIN